MKEAKGHRVRGLREGREELGELREAHAVPRRHARPVAGEVT